MPIWGWICIGLFVAAIVGVLLFYYFAMHLPFEREELIREQNGENVVGRILVANTSVYEVMERARSFEFALVVFTRENNDSEEHLAFLGKIISRLKEFEIWTSGN